MRKWSIIIIRLKSYQLQQVLLEFLSNWKFSEELLKPVKAEGASSQGDADSTLPKAKASPAVTSTSGDGDHHSGPSKFDNDEDNEATPAKKQKNWMISIKLVLLVDE